MPRSSIRDPSGTDKSAVTRTRTSCRTSLSGRNATRSPSANPVSDCSSIAPATGVNTFSGRKIVHSARSSTGNCDRMPGFQGPDSSAGVSVTIEAVLHQLRAESKTGGGPMPSYDRSGCPPSDGMPIAPRAGKCGRLRKIVGEKPLPDVQRCRNFPRGRWARSLSRASGSGV